MFAFFRAAFGAVPNFLGSFVQMGFLEQLYMTPDGFTKVMITKVVAALVFASSQTIILAYVAMGLSGNWIELNFLKLFLFMFMAAPSIVGIGFVLGGLTLVFKRVGILIGLTSMSVLALVSLPALPISLLSILPLAPGATLTRMAVLYDQPVTPDNLLVVISNSSFYFILGTTIYKYLESHAKGRNLISQY
jgi:ABC-2 type transport system permease protein